MKLLKNLMLLAAGTLVMASCLRQNTWNPYGEEEENSDRVPVKMRTYLPSSSVDVKGQGALDNWNGNQEIFIYAIAREGENAAASLDRDLDFGGDGILIKNVKAYSNPHSVENPGDPQEIELYFNEDATPMELFYYDEDRRYEFFGYYVDDAATALDEAGKPAPVIGESAITLPVTIDGSQDLMLATAHKADDNLGIGINENRMYSAYSARKGIHPNLQFDHQLARFDVRVQSGDFKTKPDLSAKLTLAKVTVDSHYDGMLYIANKQYRDNPPYLKVDESTSKPLDIWRMKSATDSLPSPLDSTHHFKLVQGEGESMTAPLLDAGTVMVMPGQQKYKIYIGMLQDEYSSGMVEYTSEIDFTHVVAAEGLEPDTEAVAGHQYYVDVIVYGLQGVDVMVSMTKWTEAGSFILDRDREVEIFIPDDKLALDFYSLTEEPITIGATTFPNEAQANMTYQSLNPAIATVDATGLVTPVGWGTTYIYISAPAVRDYASSTRIVTVTVLPYASIDVQGKDGSLPPIRVELGAGTGTGSEARDPYHLNVEQPDGQNAPLTFSIADTTIATIDEHGNISAHAVGTTSITVTAAAVKDVCREHSETVVLEVYDPNATPNP